jgi:hypothetical protein
MPIVDFICPSGGAFGAVHPFFENEKENTVLCRVKIRLPAVPKVLRLSLIY